MNKLLEECRRRGLRINKAKTEVMGITKTSERLPVTNSIEGIACTEPGGVIQVPG